MCRYVVCRYRVDIYIDLHIISTHLDRELEGKEARDVNDNSVQQPAAHQLQHHGGSTRRHLHQQCAGPAHTRASTR